MIGTEGLVECTIEFLKETLWNGHPAKESQFAVRYSVGRVIRRRRFDSSCGRACAASPSPFLRDRRHYLCPYCRHAIPQEYARMGATFESKHSFGASGYARSHKQLRVNTHTHTHTHKKNSPIHPLAYFPSSSSPSLKTTRSTSPFRINSFYHSFGSPKAKVPLPTKHR